METSNETGMLPEGDERAGGGWRAGLGVASALTALLAFHLVVNAWWQWADNHLHSYDEMWHHNNTRVYIEALTKEGPKNAVERIIELTKARTAYWPPLLYLAGSLLPLLGYDSRDTVSMTNTAGFLLLVLGMYFFARTMLDRRASFFAALVTSFVPALYGISRLHLTDLLSATVVVWCCWALMKTDRFRDTRWVLVFALLNGIGFLTRWFTFVFYITPCAIIVVLGLVDAIRSRWREGRSSKALGLWLANVVLTGAVTFAVMAPWYTANLETMYATFSGSADRVGRMLVVKTWADHAANVIFATINDGVFLPMFVVGLAGLLIAPFVLGRKYWLAYVVAATWLLGTIALKIAFPQTGTAPRHLVPLFAVFGLFSAIAVVALPWKRVRVVFGGVWTAFLLFLFFNLTFFPLGPAAEVIVPVFQDHLAVRESEDGGIVVYSDLVFASGAIYHPAQREENWVQRSLRVIAQADRERYYATAGQGNIEAFRVDKTPVEFIQSDYWPLSDPLDLSSERTRGVPSPLVPIGSPRRTLFDCVEVSSVKTPGVLEVACDPGAPLEALALHFPNVQRLATAYTARYVDAAGAEQAFDPPVDVRANRLQNRFHRFEAVRAAKVLIEFTGVGEDVSVCAPGLFRVIIQNRPLIVADMHEVSYQPKPLTADDLYVMSYVLAEGELAPKDWELLKDFDLLDEFTVYGVGRPTKSGPPHVQRVFARTQKPLITFATNPRFAVSVSGDRYPNGRWDIPFWRIAFADLVANPPDERGAQKLFWAAPAPAIADVSLGRPHDVYGLQITPFQAGFGIGEASVQYWDGERGQWRVVPFPDLVGPPFYTETGKIQGTTHPAMWAAPLRTDRLRIVLLRGAPSTPDVVYTTSVFVYGDAVDGTPEFVPLSKPIEGIFQGEAIAALDETAGATPPVVSPGGAIGWLAPPLPEGRAPVYEFGIEADGGGTAIVTVNGAFHLVFTFGSGEEGLWTSGPVTLAYRPGPDGGRYRLAMRGEFVSPGQTLSLEMRVGGYDRGGAFGLKR